MRLVWGWRLEMNLIAQRRTGVQSDEQGEQNHADDVVEDCRRDYGHADLGVEFAEFFECGDGYADGSCRKYGAVEQAGNEVMMAESRESAVEETRRDDKAEYKGERNAHNRDDYGRDARLFELLDVRAEACREHYQYDADFRKEGKTFERGRGEYFLSRYEFDKTEQNTCDYHSYDLRKSEFLAEQRKQFGNEKNKSKR